MNGVLVLEHCVVSQNSAAIGGGVIAYDSNVAIRNCSFNNNFASVRGGGITLFDSRLVIKIAPLVETLEIRVVGQFKVLTVLSASQVVHLLIMKLLLAERHSGSIFPVQLLLRVLFLRGSTICAMLAQIK